MTNVRLYLDKKDALHYAEVFNECGVSYIVTKNNGDFIIEYDEEIANISWQVCMDIMGSTLMGKIYYTYLEAYNASMEILRVHRENNIRDSIVYLEPKEKRHVK